jgi:hypothetical protein
MSSSNDKRLLDEVRDYMRQLAGLAGSDHGLAGSDHGNNLFSIKKHPISNGSQVLWGYFQARNIGHNHVLVHGA